MKHQVIIENSPNGSKKTVIVDGTVYPSMSWMRRNLGISETGIYNYKRMGYTTEEAISLCLEQKENKDKLRKQRDAVRKAEYERKQAYKNQFIFEFRGNQYANFSQCCIHYAEKFNISLNAASLKATANRTGESRQAVLERCIQKRLKSKYSRKKPKCLHVSFHTKEKAERCASALGSRVEGLFSYPARNGRLYVLYYKPIKK